MNNKTRKSPFGDNQIQGSSIKVTKPQYDMLHAWFNQHQQYASQVYLSSRSITITKTAFVPLYKALEAEKLALADKPLRVMKSITNKLKKQWELQEGDDLAIAHNGVLVKLTPMQTMHLRLAARISTHMHKKEIWGVSEDAFTILEGKKCAYISINPANIEAEAQVLSDALDVLIEHKVSTKPLTALRDQLLAQNNVDASSTPDTFSAINVLQAESLGIDITPGVVNPIISPVESGDLVMPSFDVSPQVETAIEEPQGEDHKLQIAGRTFTRPYQMDSGSTTFKVEFSKEFTAVVKKLAQPYAESVEPGVLVARYPQSWELADKLGTLNWQDYYPTFVDSVEGVSNLGFFEMRKNFEVSFKVAIGSHAQLAPLVGGWNTELEKSILTKPEANISLCGSPLELLELDGIVSKIFKPTDCFVAYSSRKLKMFSGVTKDEVAQLREAIEKALANSTHILRTEIYKKVLAFLPEAELKALDKRVESPATMMHNLADDEAQLDSDELTLGDVVALQEALLHDADDADDADDTPVVEREHSYISYSKVSDLLTVEQVLHLQDECYIDLLTPKGRTVYDAEDVQDDTRLCFSSDADKDHFKVHVSRHYGVDQSAIEKALN